MSADFWAGYISGAVGILIGNPLDILKVRLQARRSTTVSTSPHVVPTDISPRPLSSTSPNSTSSILRRISTGTAAPILGYGALNALLFVSYNRTEALLNQAFSTNPPDSKSTTGTNLWTTFIAGAIGGLATWVVSTPTELVKCRAQLSTNPETSSWDISKRIWRTEGGIRGFYFGGVVTALRDSIGYGFYFWSYELTTRWMGSWQSSSGQDERLVGAVTGSEAANVLLCGGIAGVVTWASIFPLDVIKTRVQAQVYSSNTSVGVIGETMPLLRKPERLGAVETARQAYREGGLRVFFRGLAVCSIRAFIVNAVQWATYEWIMAELGQGRKNREAIDG
ncbi:Mitochondrial basic amino acids transporter [Cytospora mali]|uniref:Mitochondrial basic amino acids transporter n=1 Tax=Cytospora mali TaxID=578113 RepID=A0A194V6E2_CYTMA|nr:Mitochondrial basic amino acids transporter [Valsa mali var. pyri (nom. inval.)]